MADFPEAQNIAEQNEGGYCNTSGDKGGETYEGISRHFHPEWGGFAILDTKPHPIKWNTIFPDLSGMVSDWYYTNEWSTIDANAIQDQRIADYFYDWHINSGGAIKEVQKVIGVTPDGQFGPHSIEALNSKDWLLDIHNARIAYYKSLNQPQFEAQWLKRANDLYSKLLNS